MPETVSWDTPLSDPAPFDPDWAIQKLALGWPPYRVARYHLDNEGEFDSELFEWLRAQGCGAEDIAHFARWRGVANKTFFGAVMHLSPAQRGSVLRDFISGKPFRVLPHRGAPSAEVAGYLDDVLADDDSDERRAWFQRLCEAHGWTWSQVGIALRRRRIAAIAEHSTGEQVEMTGSGIPVYPERFPEPQPICPFKRNYFSIGHFAALAADGPCNSPSCRKCGPELAEKIVRHLESCISSLPAVYVTQVQWESGLSARMGQRRKAKGINTFTHRAVDGTVTYVADKPLDGTAPPTSSQAMSPAEAIDFVKVNALGVPNHVSAHWSDGWDIPREAPAPSGDNVSLAGLGPSQREEFNRVAADISKSEFGFTGGVDQIPPGKWNAFRSRLEQERDRLRGS